MVYLTRKIEFSASHLYHNPAFSAEENRRVFGKCNHPSGHGHNYVLEVTVGGETDPQTGMVLDLKDLNEILETEIMRRMDHRFLNYEVGELAGQIPTCENVAGVIWHLLEPQISRRVRNGRLHRVRLWESPDLYVDCYGDGVAGEGGGESAHENMESAAAEKANESADPSARSFDRETGSFGEAAREMTSARADQGRQEANGQEPTLAKAASAGHPQSRANGVQVCLTRRYMFAASHRLHSAALDEAANQRVYGKCNNPYGHGHNYTVEVTVSGVPDPATGMIAHLEELDRYVTREVLDPFDHTYLNEDVAAFREHVPTTENLCIEIFDRLRKFPGARLERIRVEETGRNSFEYRG